MSSQGAGMVCVATPDPLGGVRRPSMRFRTADGGPGRQIWPNLAKFGEISSAGRECARRERPRLLLYLPDTLYSLYMLAQGSVSKDTKVLFII